MTLLDLFLGALGITVVVGVLMLLWEGRHR